MAILTSRVRQDRTPGCVNFPQCVVGSLAENLSPSNVVSFIETQNTRRHGSTVRKISFRQGSSVSVEKLATRMKDGCPSQRAVGTEYSWGDWVETWRSYLESTL
jgi:hypothetical protein